MFSLILLNRIAVILLSQHNLKLLILHIDLVILTAKRKYNRLDLIRANCRYPIFKLHHCRLLLMSWLELIHERLRRFVFNRVR